MDAYSSDNRALWDELAVLHPQTAFYRVEDFLAGENLLDDIVRTRIGPLEGKRLLHLQCHIGTDTLSLARLGAEVTGLDFSPNAIEAARKLSRDSGVPGQFVLTDVLEASEALRDFDIVFASWGALQWIRDPGSWMRIAARSLKPGGKLFIADGHPVLYMLDEKVSPDRAFTIRYSYDSDVPEMDETQGSYAERGAILGSPRSWIWLHGIGTILTAMIDAGFRLRSFEELDRVPWEGLPQLVKRDETYWGLPNGAPWFPLSFVLQAERAP